MAIAAKQEECYRYCEAVTWCPANAAVQDMTGVDSAAKSRLTFTHRAHGQHVLQISVIDADLIAIEIRCSPVFLLLRLYRRNGLTIPDHHRS